MPGRLLLKTHKHLLYIISREKKQFLRFNLKTKKLEKKFRDGIWRSVEQQYEFFRDYSIHDLESSEKFKKMIELSRDYNPRCTSLSTFIVRLAECLVYENYLIEGIQYAPDHNWGSSYIHLKHPLNDYDKITIKLFKESQFPITCSFERIFFDNKHLMTKVTNCIFLLNVPLETKKRLLEMVEYRWDEFFPLVIKYNYEMRALFLYLVEYLEPFENLRCFEGITELHDYYEMAEEVGRDVKKYPKYLKSMHDIIRANYDSFKRDYDEKRFIELQKPDLEYKDKEYCIRVPKSTKEIVAEGTQLNHCVSSYVDKILEGRTLIIFLRKVKEPDNSLVTLEFKENKIIQAKGSYNRPLEKPEMEFLKKYCEHKKMGLTI